jgi:predicted DNA-binding transcriptional regulator AlpA
LRGKESKNVTRIIRDEELRVKLGLGQTSLDELTRKDPSFPKPVTIGARGRAKGRFEDEVDAWLEKLRAERDSANGDVAARHDTAMRNQSRKLGAR